MRAVEHAIDVWDLKGMDTRLDSRMLLRHLNEFAADGWELVWMSLNVELSAHEGPSHVLVFKRVLDRDESIGP